MPVHFTVNFGFINNPWFIGIVGGLITWLLTNFIASRRENKNNIIRLNQANQEILYAIRPTIAKKTLPSAEAINATILATSLKYTFPVENLYDLTAIINILIKEIMENSFLTPEIKKEMTAQLLNVKSPTKPKILKSDAYISQYNYKVKDMKYEQLAISSFAIISGIAITFITFYVFKRTSTTFNSIATLTSVILGILIAILHFVDVLSKRSKNNLENNHS